MPKNTFAKTVMNSVYVPAYIIFVDIRKECLVLKKGGLLRTGMRYRITFFKLSKTSRPSSIATGIEEKSFFNKIIEDVFEIWNN